MAEYAGAGLRALFTMIDAAMPIAVNSGVVGNVARTADCWFADSLAQHLAEPEVAPAVPELFEGSDQTGACGDVH